MILRRDDLVCQAWDAGVPVPVIATLVGLSIARIYQIKDGR
jgi:hypothetical protein